MRTLLDYMGYWEQIFFYYLLHITSYNATFIQCANCNKFNGIEKTLG